MGQPPQGQSGAPGAPPMAAPPMQQGTQQPQMATGAPTNGLRYGLNPMEVGADMAFNDGKGFPGMIAKRTEPTPLEQSMMAAGIRPGTQEWTDNMRANVKKETYIAPVAGRAGGYLVYSDGRKEFNPNVPEGMIGEQDPQTGKMVFKQDPNILAGIEASKRASALGTAGAKPVTVYGGANLTTPIQSTEAIEAIKAAGGTGPAGAAASGTTIPALAPGANESATGLSKSMTDSWTKLHEANAQANDVNMRLENIKRLAPQAITGSAGAVRDMANGLLSLTGLDSSINAKTGNDLFDKNAAQIVTALRMGSSGGGSDALQNLLGSSNPNRHMTVQAINEAVDQLKAQQDAVRAKATVLSPYVLSGNPPAYTSAELQFNRHADPRLFIMQNMEPAKAQAYIQSFGPEERKDLLTKRTWLKEHGAL